MIETPKEVRVEDKPAANGQQKDKKSVEVVDPLAQDIVEDFVKING